jgi:hypothetical protein
VPAWVEITTNILDIVSFGLITPLVIGREKFFALVQRFLAGLEKAHRWIDEVYSNRIWIIGPPVVVGVWIALAVIVFWHATGRMTDERSGYAGAAVVLAGYGLAFFLPATLALLFQIITAIAGRHGIERTLASFGAVLFMVARFMAIISAAMS